MKTTNKGRIEYHKDPMKVIIEDGLAVKTGKGLFVLKGILVDIMDKIEKDVLKIAKKVHAHKVCVPCILSQKNMESSQYLDSFENLAIRTEPHKGLACPTVCYHYFSALKNKKVNRNFTITALADCFRNEGTNSLARLTDFKMREIVAYGTEGYCRAQNDIVLKETLKMLDKYDLTYKVISASDPFFGKNSELKKKAQQMSGAKLELRTLLPFNKKTLSVASFNLHGKVFYDRFNIKAGRRGLNYSSCVGWGYERILFTILAQKGVNFSSKYYKGLLR